MTDRQSAASAVAEVPHALRSIVEHLAALTNTIPLFHGCAEELAYLVAEHAGLIEHTAWEVHGECIDRSWWLRGNAQLIVDAILDARVQHALAARGVTLVQERLAKGHRPPPGVHEGGYSTTLKKTS